MTYIYKKRRQRQQTLDRPIMARGVGLHSGRDVSMVLSPAPCGTGIVFQRMDLSEAQPIPARYDHCYTQQYRTVIAQSEGSENYVSTIEHLMAAFYGCGIDNAYVSLDAPEVPIFDGCACDYVFLIDSAGLATQEEARKTMHITRHFEISHGESWVKFDPSSKDRLRLHMEINFHNPLIGHQRENIVLTSQNFRKKLIQNRTFVHYDSITYLHHQGLGLGGSLDNTLVIQGEDVLNPLGLRTRKEFIRHKILDALGDLYLSGCHLYGDFYGYCSGHYLNTKLVKDIFQPAQPKNASPP